VVQDERDVERLMRLPGTVTDFDLRRYGATVPKAGPSEWDGLSFRRGDRVRTAEVLEARDYTEEGQRRRRPAVLGSVEGLSNKHGLCFRVRYEDGEHGYFDPDELVLEKRPDRWTALLED
jgi:hypothetical protein